ncbi:MAG: hypothetical protein ABJ251_02130 [Paracoccaceae bacterium]
MPWIFLGFGFVTAQNGQPIFHDVLKNDQMSEQVSVLKRHADAGAWLAQASLFVADLSRPS